MKPLPTFLILCACLLITADASSAQPEHEAIVQYKAFRTAVQAGKADDALRFVEPVEKEAEPLVAAGLKAVIAQAALHAELLKQMGPPDPKDEDYLAEHILAPEVLKTLSVQVRHDDLVLLRTKDPQTKNELTLAPMIRRDGKWLIPAALFMGTGLEYKPGAKSDLPPADERQQLIEHAEVTTKIVGAMLKRLKNKEFKTCDDVVKALSDAMPKADGEVDIDEC